MDCIILAAGKSQRAGTNKLMLQIKGKTILERCIDAFDHTCNRIIVVLGHYRDEFVPLLKGNAKIHVVYNQEYQRGMFCSVKSGVRAVISEYFFLTPGDFPFIARSTVESLSDHKHILTIPVHDGISGHPILLHHSLIPHILASREQSLNDCLSCIQPHYVSVKDAGIAADVDTMADFNRWKGCFLK